jgi:hypothetical protein
MITFENSPVTITKADASTFDLLASSVSMSISNPRRGIKQLGTAGLAGQMFDGPMVGNINVSYYLAGADGVRALFGAGGGAGIQIFDVSVGAYQCQDVVMNSLSLNIEPYSAISCDVSMSFYNGYDQEGSAGALTPPADVLHGGATTVTSDLLWSSDIVSCTYSLNQSVNPVYLLGELVPDGYSIEETTVSVDIAGTGLGHILDFEEICEGYVEGNITLAGICEEAIGDSISFSGNVTDPQVTVAPNQEINGSLTVFGTF